MFVDVETSRVTLPLVLGGGPYLANMSRDDFFALCQANRPLRIERTADGDLVLLTPTGGETGLPGFTLDLTNIW